MSRARIERARTAAEDGRFRLVLPEGATGRKKVTLIAANRDNVVVSRDVEIEITP